MNFSDDRIAANRSRLTRRSLLSTGILAAAYAATGVGKLQAAMLGGIYMPIDLPNPIAAYFTADSGDK